MLFLSAVGGILLSKLSTKVIREYNMAATLAQEVLSSIRTAQAMGAEEKLAHEYNDNLAAAQRAGYKTAILSGVMFAPIFATIYFTYGLAFCSVSNLAFSNFCHVLHTDFSRERVSIRR